MVIANDARAQTAPESATMTTSAQDPSAWNGSAQAVPKAREWLERALERAARAVHDRYLERLSGGKVNESIRALPDRIQRTAQQTRLVLDLVEDVRSGAYREAHWYSLPIAAAALLYAVSPTDIVPDVFPAFGVLDDVAVIAAAVRILQGELRAYCRFKGYPEEQYFAAA
jgi:uncharacterized membrane protein YkvA (DUF1232 family)